MNRCPKCLEEIRRDPILLRDETHHCDIIDPEALYYRASSSETEMREYDEKVALGYV